MPEKLAPIDHRKIRLEIRCADDALGTPPKVLLQTPGRHAAIAIECQPDGLVHPDKLAKAFYDLGDLLRQGELL